MDKAFVLIDLTDYLIGYQEGIALAKGVFQVQGRYKAYFGCGYGYPSCCK